MNVLMEAARLNDEVDQGGDGVDQGGEFDDLDLESAMMAPEAGPASAGEKARPAPWDPEPVKAKMKELLEEVFGKKAKKILKELKKNPGSKLSILEFCDKAEKYITVFIDNKRAEEVSNRLRAVIEESLL